VPVYTGLARRSSPRRFRGPPFAWC
jgi:hypothetical protein